jgi:hypothetical protein
MLIPVYPGNGISAVHQLTSCSLFHVLISPSSHQTFQLIVPWCVVSCFLQMNLLPFLFLAMCVVIPCFVLRANCYRYFLEGLIFLNKADRAAVRTFPVCCICVLMSCRFLSTLLRLLIVLVGDGDLSLDVLGDVAGDDVGIDVFDDDDDSCSVVYISDLMASISLCCFSLCCMSNCVILFLFFSHSSAIWCLLRWFRLPVTFSLSLIPGALYLARLVSILCCFCCWGCASWSCSGCRPPLSSSVSWLSCWLPVLSCCPLRALPPLPAKKLPPMLTS